MNGKKIGINAGSVQLKLFEKCVETNGVTAVVVPCDGDSAIVEKLSTGAGRNKLGKGTFPSAGCLR